MFEPIIITGYGHFEYAKRAIELSVVDYILKPIDEEKLQQAVKKAIANIENRQLLDALKLRKDEGLTLVTLLDATHDEYVRSVLKIIRDRYTEYLSIDKIGKEIGLSPGYLSRKIKSETGMSLLDIHHRHRIEIGLQLLQENKSMKYYEIAEAIGFSSYKRFSSVFKKILGCVPRDIAKREGEK
jgi:two-component system response regulator YesN